MVDIIPGLKGFGTDTRAAYGATNPPEICIVDSLLTTTGNPSWDSSNYSVGVFKGTLNQCLEGVDTLNGETIDGHVVLPNSGKIILFEKSGTIAESGVNGAGNPYTYILGSYTTIAGQTSPNPGILLRNIFLYAGNKNDILIQHLRGRMDGPPSIHFGNHKSFAFANGHNLVMDHISAAWGADAQMEFWYNGTGVLENFTVSNCLFAEPRENVGLVDEQESYSAKGFMIGGYSTTPTAYPKNGLLHNNIFMSTEYRAPEIQKAQVLIVNNYHYNNENYSLRTNPHQPAGPAIYSLVGNVIKGGPMSKSNAKNFITQTGYTSWSTPLSQHSLYAIDNTCDLGTQTSSSDWSYVDVSSANTTLYADGPNYPNVKVTGENPPTDSPLWPTGLTYMPSSEVKDYVVANAGAYPAFRDSLDLRFIDELTNNTGRSSLASGPPASGDWPTLAENDITLNIPSNPHTDSGDGYTNLEKWLHQLAAEVEGKYVPPPPVTCDQPTPNHPSGCDLLKWSDTSGDGIINTTNTASRQLANGEITQEEFDFIEKAVNAGSINAICPGCYTPPPTEHNVDIIVPIGAELRIDGKLFETTKVSRLSMVLKTFCERC